MERVKKGSFGRERENQFSLPDKKCTMPDAESIAVPTFHGDFRYRVDTSRRLMLPAGWRPKDPKVVLTAVLWPIKVEQYVLVLPPERWQKMLDAFKTQSLGDERVAALERTIGGTSASLVLDKVGRFLLPDHLARPAGLEKEVQFVGRLGKFEIWNPERRGVASPDDKTLAAAVVQEINL